MINEEVTKSYCFTCSNYGNNNDGYNRIDSIIPQSPLLMLFPSRNEVKRYDMKLKEFD